MKLRKLGNNQTEIVLENVDILVSYETPVAAYHKASNTYYRTLKRWSATTARHIKSWLPDFDNAEVKDQAYFDDLLRAGKFEK